MVNNLQKKQEININHKEKGIKKIVPAKNITATIKLKGIMVFNGVYTALIEDQNGSHSVRVGDRIAGGQVLRINKSSMVLEINGENKLYRLN